jgi:hypothetical protein
MLAALLAPSVTESVPLVPLCVHVAVVVPDVNAMSRKSILSGLLKPATEARLTSGEKIRAIARKLSV